MSAIKSGPIFLLFALLVTVESLQTFTNFMEFEKLADNLQEILTQEVSDLSQCSIQFRRYLKGLRTNELWALKMFDAGSKIPTGILIGNNGDLGFFDECLNLETETDVGVIQGKYCLGNISLSLKTQTADFNTIAQSSPSSASLKLKLATCLPSACSAADIERIYRKLRVNITYVESACQTKASQPELDGIAIATIALFGIIVIIMISSTIYDVYNFYTEKKSAHILLTAFSIFTNGKKLLAISNNPQQITCLHGIRTISMMWIIFGHRLKTSLEVMLLNELEVVDWKQNFVNSYMLGAAVAVDTFFLISGLVISYVFMNAMDKGTKFNVPMYYVHRYLRLTPAYAMVILINVSLMKHLASGPQWPVLVEKQLEAPCRQYWWSALLYVQNYVNPGQPCMGQTWYLSVDTQLFLLSPLLLIPFYKWPKMRPFALVALILATTLTAFFLSYFEELSLALSFTNPERGKEYIKMIYYPTHTRAAPWLIGLGTGYIIHATKNSKFTFRIFGIQHHLINIILWVGSLAVLFACVLGSYDVINGKSSTFAQASFTGFVSPAWAIGLSCIILACVHDYGGPVNWILSNPFIQVISKLTYSMYILHKLVLSIYIYSARTCLMVNNFEATHSFWGDFVFTLALSVFWVFAFESPIIALEKVIFGHGNDKSTAGKKSNDDNRPLETNNAIENNNKV